MERMYMTTALGITLMGAALASPARAELVRISAMRSADTQAFILGGANGAPVEASEFSLLEEPNWNAPFASTLNSNAAIPNAGTAQSSITYASSISSNVISSNASLSVVAQNTASFLTEAASGYSSVIEFAVRSETFIVINGSLSASGNGDTTVELVHRPDNTLITADQVLARWSDSDSPQTFRESFTLGQGEYRLFISNSATATLFGNEVPDLASIRTHDVKLRVVPGPAPATLLAIGFGFASRRKR